MDRFNKLPVAVRLGAVVGLLSLALILVAVISLTRLETLNDEVELLAQNRVPAVLILKHATDEVNHTVISLRDIVITDKTEEVNHELAELEEARGKVNEDLAKLKGMITSQHSLELFAAVSDKRAGFSAAAERMIAAVKAGDRQGAIHILLAETRPLQLEYMKALAALSAYQVERIEETERQAEKDFHDTIILVVVVSVVMLALTIGMAVVTIRAVLKQLGGEPDHVAGIARQIAAGKLNIPVVGAAKDKNSIFAAMQHMQGELKDTVSNIIHSAGQLTETAASLAATSNQVSLGSCDQSESTSSMAAAIEELTVSVNHVADNASKAQAEANESGELSKQGAVIVDGAMHEMEKIAASIRSSAELISTLERQSSEIHEIVNVINEIADQTNLLALNAAIEAARAGEQGRGFAVVADEVRKLAERTSSSTQEIAVMIDRIQQGTREAVGSMEAGVSMANDGVAMASKAGEAINAIKAKTMHTAELVSDISYALREQSAATNDIARHTEKIAQMCEENSAASQQTANAASHLEQLATALHGGVTRFQV